MNKRILYVVVIILVLLAVAYNLQNYLTQDVLPYSLQKLYLFHGIAVLIVYMVHRKKKVILLVIVKNMFQFQ